MPLTSNLSTITVTGSYVDLAGQAVSGAVTFTPRNTIIDLAANQIIVPATITATLSGGSFSVVLPVTNDPDLLPTGFTYAVVENFAGGRTFDIALPSSLGATVDLADLSPSTSDTGAGSLYASYIQYLTTDSRLTTLEATLSAASTSGAAATSATATAAAASQAVAAASIHPFTLMGA